MKRVLRVDGGSGKALMDQLLLPVPQQGPPGPTSQSTQGALVLAWSGSMYATLLRKSVGMQLAQQET